MARQSIKVTYTDGEQVEVRITPKVEIALEKHFGTGVGSMSKDQRAEHLYWLAWQALTSAGKEGRSFEDFLDILDDVDLVDAEDVNPTRPVRRRGSSSN